MSTPLAGWKLILTWVLLGTVCVLMWWALIEHVFLPFFHAAGGIFRMGAIR